jgi:hypothetical protein
MSRWFSLHALRSPTQLVKPVEVLLSQGKICFTDRSETCPNASADMILDPVFIPPFHGIHLHAVDLHGEVQMVAAGQPSGSGLAHGLAAFHRVAFFNREFA